MSKDKQVILISESEKLYKSLKRAFKFLEGIDIIRITPTDNLSFVKDDSILLFEGIREDDFYKFRNNARLKYRLFNPLAAFCYEAPKSFIGKSDNYHFYFHAPFELQSTVNSIKNLQPIPSNRKILEYFPVWLKNDSHTIQNLLLASGKKIEAINFVEDLLEAFNPPDPIKEEGKNILNLLKEESWRENAFNITLRLCNFLDNLYKEGLTMKGEILVIDDEITEKGPLGNFFKELSKELGYNVIFIQKPEEVEKKITQDTKFVFLDIEFKGYSSSTVNEIRDKIKPIPYIIFSKYPKNPLERLNTGIQEIVKQLLKFLKGNPEYGDIKFTIDAIGKMEKEYLLEDIDAEIHNIKNSSKQAETIKSLLTSLKNAIERGYPDDIYPEIRRCVAYVEKKYLERKRPLIKQLIESATRFSDNNYGIDIDTQNKIIKVIDLYSEQEICNVSLNQREWEFFNKCYIAYPNAADFNYRKSLPEGKKSKFYNTKYEIEKDIKEKSGGKVIRIFERVGKGLFKLSIKPHKHEITTAATYTKEIEFVTRKEFNKLKEKVEKILSILEKQ